MTESEWQEIVRLVTETASKTAREYIASAHKKEPPKKPPALSVTDSIRQKQIEIIQNGLERYRESEPESAIRKVIDQLLRLHASLVNPNDRFYRTRHNILVLKYIVSQPMSDREIRKRLGMGTYSSGYDNQLEKGIQEIAALFFWNGDIWDM